MHLGGMAWLFHLVSVVEMLALAHRWVPVGVREVQSLLGLAVVSIFFLVWWIYGARNRAEHPFAKESRELLRTLVNSRSHIVYSKPDYN